MANQTQIPVIQSQDGTQVLTQQNTNKVLRNLNNQIVVLQNTVDKIQGIGDVILSPLILSQFQAIHGKTWIEANGQSSVGTEYYSLTMILTVPTITVAGSNAYIKVNS